MSTTHDTRTGLDEISPATHPARDASAFRDIRRAARAVETAQEDLRAAVREARRRGDSWTVIGVALGVSKQAAQQRFGSDA